MSACHIISQRFRKGQAVRHVVRRWPGRIAWLCENAVGIWFDNGLTYEWDRFDANTKLEIIR